MLYDVQTEKVVTVIESDSPQYRVEQGSKQRDTMLVEFDINGIVRRAVSFTLSNKFDMMSYPQNFIKTKDQYFLVGGLTGFLTRFQYDTNDLDF